MADIDLLSRLEADQKSMEEVGTALIKRDRRGTIAAMTRWVVNALSGIPALGTLAQQGVARVFASTATAASRPSSRPSTPRTNGARSSTISRPPWSP
jgi:hypothetical protein